MADSQSIGAIVYTQYGQASETKRNGPETRRDLIQKQRIIENQPESERRMLRQVHPTHLTQKKELKVVNPTQTIYSSNRRSKEGFLIDSNNRDLMKMKSLKKN